MALKMVAMKMLRITARIIMHAGNLAPLGAPKSIQFPGIVEPWVVAGLPQLGAQLTSP